MTCDNLLKAALSWDAAKHLTKLTPFVTAMVALSVFDTNWIPATRRGNSSDAESRRGVPLQSALSKLTVPVLTSTPPGFTLKEASTPSAK